MPRLPVLLVRFGLVLRLALGAMLLLGAHLAHALPSACAAQWGTAGGNLNYYNPVTNLWVTAVSTGAASPNAMGGYEGDGTLYFAQSTAIAGNNMLKATFSNTSATGVSISTVGGISIPSTVTYYTSGNVATSIALGGLLGATFDRDASNRRMFLYATTGNTNLTGATINGTTTNAPLAAIGLLDPESPGAVSWVPVFQTRSSPTTGYTYPLIGSSGDIFADQQSGKLWIVTNSQPNRMLELSLSYTGYTLSSAQVVGTASIQIGGVDLTASQGAVAVDPVSGLVYISSGNSNSTWQLTDHTARPIVSGTLVNNTQGEGDSGNCVAPPDPPTVEKSFSPTTATSPGTSTLVITISNPNKVPIYTNAALTDSFPANLRVSNTPALTGSCYSDGTVLGTRPTVSTITATAGGTSASISAGTLIPGGSTSGGSCSFSVRVSATVANLYDNTIAAGDLSTTAGSNAAAATASFQIQNLSLPNLPTISKSFNPTSSANTPGTTTLTIIITNPNTSTNTLSAIFKDNLPTNMRVANVPGASRTCYSDGVPLGTQPAATTLSAVVRSTSVTIALNSVIPGGTVGGSCSFSVRVSTTVAGVYENSIPAGSLSTASGSNADEATATFFARGSDFTVVKSQREGVSGGTTTAQLDVASGVTISYVISIRNIGGVDGTRTFTDTLPTLITPSLSLTTATVAGATGCRVTTSTVAGPSVRIVGTVTGAPIDGGCDITVVAKSSVTSVIGTATNSVGIHTVTGAFETDTGNDSASVVLVIKPAANLSITKTDGITSLLTGSTNAYTITVANGGPSDADGAVVFDGVATGLDCSGAITCSTTGGATCPLGPQAFVNALQTTGVAIPVFPSGSSVSLVFTCTVTATGEP